MASPTSPPSSTPWWTTTRLSLEQGRFSLPDPPTRRPATPNSPPSPRGAELLGQARAGTWFRLVRLVRLEHRDLFPALPDRTRYHRVLRNLERVPADLALCLAASSTGEVYVIDSKPIPICKGSRFRRPRAMVEAATGRSSLGWFHGLKLHAVVNTQG